MVIHPYMLPAKQPFSQESPSKSAPTGIYFQICTVTTTKEMGSKIAELLALLLHPFLPQTLTPQILMYHLVRGINRALCGSD